MTGVREWQAVVSEGQSELEVDVIERFFSSQGRQEPKSLMKRCSRQLEAVRYQRHGAQRHEQAQRPPDLRQK